MQFTDADADAKNFSFRIRAQEVRAYRQSNRIATLDPPRRSFPDQKAGHH